MSTAQLARSESMRPQSMSVLLAALEKQGLVAREDHPDDRRQIMFQLTPAGAASNRQRRRARQAWLVGAMSRFTAEERDMLIGAIGLLKRLGESDQGPL